MTSSRDLSRHTPTGPRDPQVEGPGGQPLPCPGCGYDLRGTRRGAPCPECGGTHVAARIRATATALEPESSREEELERAFSELGTAAAGTLLLWAGCVWLPLIGPVAWAVTGMFCFWRLTGTLRLRSRGVLQAEWVPFPATHAFGLCITECVVAVAAVGVTAAASVGIWPTALRPVAGALQAVLIAVIAGQLAVHARLAGAVAAREGVHALRVSARIAAMLAPVAACAAVPVLANVLSRAWAIPASAVPMVERIMTALLLGLGLAGVVSAISLRVAMQGLANVVPGGVDAPPRPRRTMAMPVVPPPAWADQSDEPIPLVEDDSSESAGDAQGHR